MPFLKHSQSAIRWETIRTLGLIANYEKEILAEIETFTTDSNEQIKQASINAINRIEQRNKLK
jgi:HEAT repeat protein